MLVKTSNKSKILFGADPESFAACERDGKLYAMPPYWFRHEGGIDPIEEDERHPVFIETDEYKVHEDGAAFEFSILPSYNPKDLFGRIQAASEATSFKILQWYPQDVLPNLQFIPTIGWDVQRWAGMPKDFFMSTTFGCDPDDDVFNLQKKAQDIDASKHPFRYAGGHIHFSGSLRIVEDPHFAVRCQVVTSGVAAVFYSPVPQLERDRTFLYGRPGKFREQNYGKKNPYGPEYAMGIEYRTPSATWAGNWGVAEKVLEWAEIGIHELLETSLGEEIVPEVTQPAIEAILTANQDLAGQVLQYVTSKL